MGSRKAWTIIVFLGLTLASGAIYSTAYEASTDFDWPSSSPGGGGGGGNGDDGSVELIAPDNNEVFEPEAGEEATIEFEFEIDSDVDGDAVLSVNGEEEETFEHNEGVSTYTYTEDFSDGSYEWRVTFQSGGDTLGSATRQFSVNELPEDPIHCYYQQDGEFQDADGDGLAGYNEADMPEDPGCVLPLWRDEVEGLAWEPHISTTMEGESNNIDRPEIYFANSFVEMGNDLESNSEDDSVTGSGSGIEYTSYYIGNEGSESDDNWGFGTREEMTITGFSDGDIVDGDRVVLGPNPDSDTAGGSTCGDGYEDSDYERGDPDGQESEGSTSGYTTECRPDFGRIWEKYDLEDPMDNDCDNDDASCEGDAEVSCESGSTGGSDSSCYSDDCGTETSADCDLDEDNSGHEGNEEFRASGDLIEVRECTNDGSCSQSNEENCIDYDGDSCTSSNAGGSWDDCHIEDPEEGCIGSCTASNSDPCSADTWEGEGEERSWNSWSEEHDCTDRSTVDGGTSSPDDYENSQAATYTRFTAHQDASWGGDGKVWCGYDHTTTINADGPWGLGNGFVVIYEDEIVATENPAGDDEVGQHVYVDESNADYDFTDKIDTDCDGSRTCIKYANFYTESSGWTASNNPSESEVRSAVDVDVTRAYTPDESYSVCKNVNRINEENGNGDTLLDCDYMSGEISFDNISPLPEACGDEEDEQLMLMEGPQVDQGSVEEHLFHEQKCVSWGDDEVDRFDRELDENACVNKGEAFAEGTVANVAFPDGLVDSEPEHYNEYEEGGDSPDWQVCLNIADSPYADAEEVTDKPYNHRYNDWDEESFGGQWYDLDDSRVNDYLTQGNHDITLTSEQRADTPSDEEIHHIDYYYGEHPNPSDSTYNPEGENEGTALLADCGPLIEGCGDDGSSTSGGVNADEGTFFTFFEESAVDPDYHPQGETEEFWYPTESSIEPVFNPPGMMNLIKSHQDTDNSRYPGQLSPGHYEYDNWNREWYEDTQIDEESAVQFAYTRDTTWVVDSTGTPYPAWGVEDTGYESDDMGQDDNIQENEEGFSAGIHYNLDYTGSIREQPSDDTVNKPDRAMANSLAVVSAVEMTDDEGNMINEGEAFWIDPDDLRYHADEGVIAGIEPETDDWQRLVQYEIDLTGPDSGLGWDWSYDEYYDEDRDPEINPEVIETDDDYGSDIVYTDIYWEEDDGDLADGLEPPMCGDDRWEYLLEEKGESANPDKYSGRYACATDQSLCVSYEGDDDQVLYEQGDYLNTNGPGEDEGRLKQDEEACAQRPEDDVAMWWDQDYGQIDTDESSNLCRENSLFGSQGKRWINYDYINEYPFAVNEGIDDSWNARLNQMSHDYLISDPEGEEWIDDYENGVGPLEQDYTPVPTGTEDERVADPSHGEYGFCAGDDASEYLIRQESQTRFLDTKDEVKGVALSPDSCVLENDYEDYEFGLEGSNDDDRRIYQEGDTVDFESGGTEREIGCFEGQWWDDWPVQFLEDNSEVGLSDTDITTFRVINPQDSERTFDLTLTTGDEDLERMVSFSDSGSDEMSVTVPARSSNTYDVEIRGLDLIDNEELQLRAESSRGDLDGTDTIDISVVEGYVSETEGEIRDVSGLTFMHLALIFLLGLVYFIYRE